jgi:hypothetical protein
MASPFSISLPNSIPILPTFFTLHLQLYEVKESRPGGPSFEMPTRERLKVEGTGYKAKTIKENLSSPYALHLAPYT